MAETEPKPGTTPANTPPASYSLQAIHALRTTQNNTLKLSQMADQKASILMGATFLVFSISLGRSLTVSDLPWALWILAGFAFASSLCAVVAVLPSVGRSAPGKGARRNRLFFGHFHELDEEEWTEDVLAELHTDEAVFRLMLHDIYQNGIVLQRRKYRYLTYAYRIFVFGLLATLVAAVVELGFY